MSGGDIAKALIYPAVKKITATRLCGPATARFLQPAILLFLRLTVSLTFLTRYLNRVSGLLIVAQNSAATVFFHPSLGQATITSLQGIL